MMFGPTMRNTVYADPRMMGGGGGYGPGSMGPGGMTGMPDYGGGMDPASLPMVPQTATGGGGYMAPQMPGQGGGGWLSAIKGALGGMGMDGAYLGLAAVGGVADYFERKREHDLRKRMYDEGRADDQMHRRRMGENLQQAWG